MPSDLSVRIDEIVYGSGVGHIKVVFADTGYWVAVLNPKDDWNTRANEVSRSLGKVRIVTTEMVLAELLAALKDLCQTDGRSRCREYFHRPEHRGRSTNVTSVRRGVRDV